MKHLLTHLIVLSTISVYGQDHLLGIKCGANWTKIASAAEEIGSYFRPGFIFGLTYDHKPGDHLLLGTELIYLQRGVLHDAFALDEYGNIIRSVTQGKTEYLYEYLALPIKVGYMVGERMSGFVNVGIIPSYLLSAKTIWAEQTAQYLDDKSDFTEIVTTIDLAGLVEAGGHVSLSKSLRLGIVLSFQRSFTATIKDEYRIGEKRMHYGFALTGALKYIL